MGLYVILTADGRAYAVKDVSTMQRVGVNLSIPTITDIPLQRERRLSSGSEYSTALAPQWDGQCFYGATRSPDPSEGDDTRHTPVVQRRQAVKVAFNEKFSLVAIGLNRYGHHSYASVHSVLIA